MSTDRENLRRAASVRARILAAILMSAPLVVGAPAKAGLLSSSVLATVSVFTTGLDNPRGLKFGPDGNLYVAEGGPGGTNSTVGQCVQVPDEIGPYLGSPTGGRITRIDANGDSSVVTDTFPSSQTNATTGSLVSGVADVAFIGNTLYALIAGGGCSHGVPSIPNGIARVEANGAWTLIADLSAFQMAHPVAHPDLEDFEPDGTWYSMVAVRGDLYAVEPNHGEIVKITTDGGVSRVVDFSASQGHAVPTALTYKGNFYLGNLGVFPQAIGSSKVWKMTPSGQLKVDATGFDMVLGVTFDNRARMYVLEMSAGSPAPVPGTGRITRVDPNGAKTIVADHLLFPTGMTFGPDGNLYVSNGGIVGPGGGSILKVGLSN